ncbi:hypothetical protein IAT40_003423 [Kwoniella sp. CBS 6097]
MYVPYSSSPASGSSPLSPSAASQHIDFSYSSPSAATTQVTLPDQDHLRGKFMLSNPFEQGFQLRLRLARRVIDEDDRDNDNFRLPMLIAIPVLSVITVVMLALILVPLYRRNRVHRAFRRAEIATPPPNSSRFEVDAPTITPFPPPNPIPNPSTVGNQNHNHNHTTNLLPVPVSAHQHPQRSRSASPASSSSRGHSPRDSMLPLLHAHSHSVSDYQRPQNQQQIGYEVRPSRPREGIANGFMDARGRPRVDSVTGVRSPPPTYVSGIEAFR